MVLPPPHFMPSILHSEPDAPPASIDIGKSILGQVTFRVIAQIATNCRRAPNPDFGNYLLVPSRYREHHFANIARGVLDTRDLLFYLSLTGVAIGH